jgi:hypothetical protein
MGLMLSRILQVALGFSNGGSMIAMAAGGTGAIFVTMATIASVSKRDFSGMGKFLFVGDDRRPAGRGRQHLLPDSGAVADHRRRRRGSVFRLHPLRHQPYRPGRRNQLHLGDRSRSTSTSTMFSSACCS